MSDIATLVDEAKSALESEYAADLARHIDPATVTIEIISRVITALLRRESIDRTAYRASTVALNRLAWAMERDAVATQRILANLKVGDRLTTDSLKYLERQVRDERGSGERSSQTLSCPQGCLWTVDDPRYGGFEILIDDRGYRTTAGKKNPTSTVRRARLGHGV